jgi:hypothetical protein
MQPNTITLAVDELNTDITTDHVFQRFEEFQNRSVYIGPNHTVAGRNQLSFYRTFPKQSGNFRGTAKSAVKFTLDKTVLGVDGSSSIVAPLIVEVSFSIPVGTTDADILVMRQSALALLDSDTVMQPLNSTLMV